MKGKDSGGTFERKIFCLSLRYAPFQAKNLNLKLNQKNEYFCKYKMKNRNTHFLGYYQNAFFALL